MKDISVDWSFRKKTQQCRSSAVYKRILQVESCSPIPFLIRQKTPSQIASFYGCLDFPAALSFHNQKSTKESVLACQLIYLLRAFFGVSTRWTWEWQHRADERGSSSSHSITSVCQNTREGGRDTGDCHFEKSIWTFLDISEQYKKIYYILITKQQIHLDSSEWMIINNRIIHCQQQQLLYKATDVDTNFHIHLIIKAVWTKEAAQPDCPCVNDGCTERVLSSAHFLALSVRPGGAVSFDDSLKSQSTGVWDQAVYQSEEQ